MVLNPTCLASLYISSLHQVIRYLEPIFARNSLRNLSSLSSFFTFCKQIYRPKKCKLVKKRILGLNCSFICPDSVLCVSFFIIPDSSNYQMDKILKIKECDNFCEIKFNDD